MQHSQIFGWHLATRVAIIGFPNISTVVAHNVPDISGEVHNGIKAHEAAVGAVSAGHGGSWPKDSHLAAVDQSVHKLLHHHSETGPGPTG